ncbi:MAG: Gfo/Idh/MocA family protein [Verrucomicrobiota bacterium JB025]|nr:Gfo/Idh/MocA family oxidoreductase [Verrucomicrobiota bacterium JB025]
MQSPVLVGIAGYGYWGPNLARNFQQLQSAALVAVCDPDEDRRCDLATNYPEAAAYAGFDEMLANERLDAVVIATPARSHHKLAKAGLLAGKHVLIEKPMATSADECRELIELAAAGKLVLMVGHTYLYSEAVRKLFEIIASGDLGEIRYINCQRLNFGLFQKDINVAWDLAPHDLSIILRVMGRMPTTVNCQGGAHVRAGVEAVTNVSLGFDEGAFATVQSSWLEPRKVRQMTFVGTRKMVVYDDLEPHGKLRIHDIRVDCPPRYNSFAEFQYSYHYGECRIPHLEQGEPLKRMCEHFVECVVHGREPETHGGHGLEVVRVLEACGESLSAGGGPVVPGMAG